MKNKTALKQSRASVKFLSVAVAILGVLMFVCPSAYTAVPLVVELTRFRGHPILGGERSVSTMPKSHAPYSPEFRQRIIELVRKGRSPEVLARQFEPSAQAIRNWVRQADRDAGQRHDGLTTTEQDELRRLRRENRTLREEREILKNSRARRPPSHLLDEKLAVRLC